MINYTYELLKLLYTKGGKADIELIMSELTKNVPDAQLHDIQKKVASIIIYGQRHPSLYFNQLPLTIDSEISKKYMSYGRVFDEDLPYIEIELTPNGVSEYRKLKSVEEPEPPVQPIHIGGDVIGSVLGDFKGHDFNQTITDVKNIKRNEESNESKELTLEQLKDAKPNKWYRKWGFIVALAAMLLTLLLWIIDKLNKN